jgi:hypothetical protein
MAKARSLFLVDPFPLQIILEAPIDAVRNWQARNSVVVFS